MCVESDTTARSFAFSEVSGSLIPITFAFNWGLKARHGCHHVKLDLHDLRGSPSFCESSVQFSCSVMSDSLQPHGLQNARPPCSSLTPRVYSNSCPLSRWCHPTTSSSVVPFSSCLQSFPASWYFQMSQFFTSGGQSIGVSASASVLLMNSQDWFPLGWAGLISLLSKGLLKSLL